MQSFVIYVSEVFPSQIKITFCRQSQEVYKGKDIDQVESIEEHYRVNFFLPFIDHIITSTFAISQRTACNYLVPALVNNVNPEIANDMKIECWNDLPYPNDLPQEVDRWVAKCIPCNWQFVNTLCRLRFLC